MDDELLKRRLRRVLPDRLADELIDLGNRDETICERVDRLALEDDPNALAAALKLSIKSLGKAKRFVPYGRSFALAQDLQHIVDTIRERLLPRDPDLAFEVTDLFLQSDTRVFESVDDSGGAVGDVFRDACKRWLEAAAQSTVKRDWVALFKERVAKDDYGSRDELLPNAAILFSETTLREMAAEYLAKAVAPRPENDRLNYDALSAASNARQLALALRDPRLFEEATKAVGGGLNNLQRIEIVRKYLEFGDPETALAHLQKVPDTPSSERLDLLAECYGKLGRIEEQISALQTIFERTLWKRAYEQILALRPQAERDTTREWGRRIALGFGSADTAASFLFECGWPDDAEKLAVDRVLELVTTDYTRLLDLAVLAEKAGRRIVEVICYRHLIQDILNSARNKAYGHAARYMEQLAALDASGVECGSLGDHATFAAELRTRHGRKSAFWRRVDS